MKRQTVFYFFVYGIVYSATIADQKVNEIMQLKTKTLYRMSACYRFSAQLI